MIPESLWQVPLLFHPFPQQQEQEQGDLLDLSLLIQLPQHDRTRDIAEGKHPVRYNQNSRILTA